MSKIKTREKVKDVKVLDKSKVVGERMKSAFIRSKDHAKNLADDGQATPSEYAEDQVQYAAEDISRDAAHAAGSGVKTVGRKGREAFQRHRAKAAEQKAGEQAPQGEQPPAPDADVPSEPRQRPRTLPQNTASTEQPSQGLQQPAAPKQRPQGIRQSTAAPKQRPQGLRQAPAAPEQPSQGLPQTTAAPEQRPRPPQRNDPPRQYGGQVKPANRPDGSRADTNNAPDPVERGRERVKKQAAKRADATRQIKQRQTPPRPTAWGKAEPEDSPISARRQIGKAAHQVTDKVEDAAHTVKQSAKTVRKANRAVKQTAKSTGKATVKTAKRTVKTAQQTAKGAVKTAERTSKAAIKTAEHTAKATQKAAQAAAKAAKVAAQAARATAKAAAAAAKATAKAIAATVKAIIAAVKALIAAIAAGGWVAVLVIVVICLIGLLVASCFGIFFSGEDSGTGQTMQTAVQEINQSYEEKLETTKTSTPHDVLEMTGSRAVWPDVLAVYAVKTTTDPDNPQEVATMDDGKKAILKEIFWAMNEVSSYTTSTTHTSTIMVDDGSGNMVESTTTVTTITLHITVSHKTAEEMAVEYGFTADQREQLAELLAEENNSLWSAVLYGIGPGDNEIVVIALSQIGNVGGMPYWSWYGFNERVEWCACFVSWCANECSYIENGIIPQFAWCPSGVAWFQERGLWQDGSYEPRPGDIIFFDWNDPDTSGQDGSADHVGIVDHIENGYVYTVEGNSGDSCRQRSYAIGYYEILGYGTPAY